MPKFCIHIQKPLCLIQWEPSVSYEAGTLPVLYTEEGSVVLAVTCDDSSFTPITVRYSVNYDGSLYYLDNTASYWFPPFFNASFCDSGFDYDEQGGVSGGWFELCGTFSGYIPFGYDGVYNSGMESTRL